MKADQSLLLLSLGVLLFSCKKDGAGLNIVYPSDYHKTGIKTNGNLRVFSSAGEINNPSIISRFNKFDSSFFSETANNIGNYPGRLDSVKFSDAQHAMMNDNYTSSNCLVSQEGANIILTRTDTTAGFTYFNERTHHISYYIGQVKPDVYSEYLVSSTRGEYIFGYSEREKFVLNLSGNQMVAPLIQYNLYAAYPNTGGYFGGSVNNLLQDDFYKNMSTGDTVTLKEYLVLFEK